MGDYDHCDKHSLDYMVPHFIVCPYCYLEGLIKTAELDDSEKSGQIELDRYDADILNEILSDYQRISSELAKLKEAGP